MNFAISLGIFIYFLSFPSHLELAFVLFSSVAVPSFPSSILFTLLNSLFKLFSPFSATATTSTPPSSFTSSAVRDQYIRIGEGFICMYSITNEASFKEVSNLRDKICSITEEESHAVVLVGNKCDLESDRQVKKEAGEALAKQYGWRFLEGSAKAKINVTETFLEIVRAIRVHRQGKGGEEDQGGETQDGSADAGKDAGKSGSAKKRRGGCTLL